MPCREGGQHEGEGRLQDTARGRAWAHGRTLGRSHPSLGGGGTSVGDCKAQRGRRWFKSGRGTGAGDGERLQTGMPGALAVARNGWSFLLVMYWGVWESLGESRGGLGQV